MKRAYAKPFLAVESFQLDAAIAGACADAGSKTLNLNVNNCVAPAPDYFFSNNCDISDGIDVTDNDLGGDGYCYQGPIAGSMDISTVYLES